MYAFLTFLTCVCVCVNSLPLKHAELCLLCLFIIIIHLQEWFTSWRITKHISVMYVSSFNKKLSRLLNFHKLPGSQRTKLAQVGNAPDLFRRCEQFESRLGKQLYWLKVFFIFCSPSRYSSYSSFPVLSSSPIIFHHHSTLNGHYNLYSIIK